MDGWMGGWVDEWMDGWVDGWTGGWMHVWVSKEPEASVSFQFNIFLFIGTTILLSQPKM